MGVGQCERIPEPLAKDYFIQIINGLEHCNDLKIVHRDLKPENILVTGDGVIKISGEFCITNTRLRVLDSGLLRRGQAPAHHLRHSQLHRS